MGVCVRGEEESRLEVSLWEKEHRLCSRPPLSNGGVLFQTLFGGLWKNFVSIAGIFFFLRNVFLFKNTIFFLSVGIHSDSHKPSCVLSTETHNLFFRLFFPSDFSEVIGEKHSFELPVTVG